MSESNDICAHCGAPRAPGYGACKFCGTVFAREQQTSTQDNVIPCPKCRTVNEWGAQKCVQCEAWVVVQCLFCSSLSPHHVPACLRCREAFAGAPERFAQRQAAQQGQQRMQVIGTVGNVAASFLGAAAGMAVGGAWSGQGYRHEGHHGHPHHSSYDGGGGYDNSVNSGNDGGFFGAITGGSSDDSGQGNVDPSTPGGAGGGLMDSLFGGRSSDGGSSSSDGSGEPGGAGGGLMDDLFGGSSGGGSDDS